MATPEVSAPLPATIHLVWLGSPLPAHKLGPNIASYATLNPVRGHTDTDTDTEQC